MERKQVAGLEVGVHRRAVEREVPLSDEWRSD